MRLFTILVAQLLVGIAGATPAAQTTQPLEARTEARTASPATPPHNEVSLYLSLRAHDSGALERLKATDLTIRDRNRVIDSHEAQVTTGNKHPLLTILFDRLGSPDRRRAAQLATKLLKQINAPAADIALWQTDSSLHIVRGYTNDHAALAESLRLLADGHDAVSLAAAVAQERLLSSPDLPDAASPAHAELRELSLASLRDTAELVSERQLPAGIAALLAAAQAQRTLDGRKALLVFTEAVPSGAGAPAVLRSLYEQLSAAGVSLYLVDLHALDRNADQGMAAALMMGAQTASNHAAVAAAAPNRPGTSASAATPKTLNLAPSQFERMTDTISTIELGGLDLSNGNPLATVARATGGGATDSDANLGILSRGISATLKDVVELSFPVPAEAHDGTYHPVLVTSNVKGITVASPGAYFAQPEADPLVAASPAEGGNGEAGAEWHRLGEGATSSDLLVHAGLRHTDPSSGARSEVAVQVPVDQLELRHDDTTHLLTLHVTLAAELADAAGRPVAHFAEEFHRRGAAENEKEIRAGVLTLLRPLSLPAGTYQLHALVRDWLSGKLGESTASVTIAPGITAGQTPAARLPSAADLAAPTPGEAAAREKAEVAVVLRGLQPRGGLPLSPGEASTLLDSARAKALAYADSLPNFLCIERVDRSVDPHDTGLWKHRDTLVELLRYRKGKESRTMLEINGEKSSLPVERVEGARSNGEFGGILDILFAPESKTAFTWAGTVEGEGDTLQVFHFQLEAPQSQYFVTDSTGRQLRAGLHGLLYIDANTQAVRRLLAQTAELPSDFGIRASWMTVEYNYIAINNHEYLLPVEGETGLQQRKRSVALMQLRFSDYRRFGSHATIRYPATEPTGGSE